MSPGLGFVELIARITSGIHLGHDLLGQAKNRNTSRPLPLGLMRYYFDYQDATGITFDDRGIDLPDIEAARLAALRSLVEAIRDQPPSRAPSLSVNIRTDDGLVLSMSTSLEIVSSDGGRTRAVTLRMQDQPSTPMTGRRPARACLN
ncbi:DUF6894 family protein [Bradyrhizobium liaoningense]|uniref:DUF6894 family protein n=1 Tax=Bradyrhizobium liaoningense TaxID=43992 RepID=UPI001BA7B0AC|nr:hypothetical protein [Bradyrhizobium liaoningense]MBR0712654.1 hypothetical protein [Bradyrhizobium liaoningense]